MASPSDPQLANRILRGLVFGLIAGAAAPEAEGEKQEADAADRRHRRHPQGSSGDEGAAGQLEVLDQAPVEHEPRRRFFRIG